MTSVLTSFIGVLILVSLFASATVWARRETRVRGLAVAAFVLCIPVVAIALSEPLGWHKPSWMAWRLGGETRVLAHKMVEGEAIYLYLDVGRGEPRAVALPWNNRTAEELEKALRESERKGQRGAMMRFDHSWDIDPPQFHPLPQPQLPMQKGGQEEPHQYERAA